jgi:hypothetical protein
VSLLDIQLQWFPVQFSMLSFLLWVRFLRSFHLYRSIVTLFLLFEGLLFLIDSMHAASVHTKDNSDDSSLFKTFDDDQDDTRSYLTCLSDEHNRDFLAECSGFFLAQHRLASRGARLPSESIRRLPVEAVLLGRRDLTNEGVLYGKRR